MRVWNPRGRELRGEGIRYPSLAIRHKNIYVGPRSATPSGAAFLHRAKNQNAFRIFVRVACGNSASSLRRDLDWKSVDVLVSAWRRREIEKIIRLRNVAR